MFARLKAAFQRSLAGPVPGPSACGADCDAAFTLVRAVSLGHGSQMVEDVAAVIWTESQRVDPLTHPAYTDMSWRQMLGRMQEGDSVAAGHIYRHRAMAHAAIEAAIPYVRRTCRNV